MVMFFVKCFFTNKSRKKNGRKMGEEKDSYSAYLISMIAKAKYGIS